MQFPSARGHTLNIRRVALAAVMLLSIAAVAKAATALRRKHVEAVQASAATVPPSVVPIAEPASSPYVSSNEPLVSVYPSPGDRYETPQTQIVFRGIPASAIGTVTVTGSKSGAHLGQIEADSDGDGGSFVPITPFTPGEKVTVTTSLNIVDGKKGQFSFSIETPATPETPETLPDAQGPNDVQHFHSLPTLEPAAVDVTKDSEPASDGDIFVAPQFGPTENGPMILDPHGNLIWFDPIPISDKLLVTDFRVQQLANQPVLTWFQGTTNNGSGRGIGVILNSDYQEVATVKAGNGLTMDLHEFYVTNSGDAYIISVSPLYMPGRSRAVENGVVQEIDIKTGLVLFQWDALDHINLADSSNFSPTISGHVLDPYHLNSVSLDAAGNPVVSARNTSAVYDIDRSTGHIVWTLGGKESSFTLGPGVSTAFQHDAVVQPGGDLTIFDDGGGPPKVHPYSRGIEVALNLAAKTATLVHQYSHAPTLSAAFEGSVQQLASGDTFLGWGQQPYFSEVNAQGQTDFDAHFVVGTASYRAYRFVWNAQPPTLPALDVGASGGGTTTLWESWNGATDVAAWRVLAGPSATQLSAIGRYPKYKFESTLTPGTGDRYVAVQALGTTGAVLATTTTHAVPNHTQIFGRSSFVAASGTGSVPVGCYSTQPCHISATLSSGTTVLAKTGSQSFAAGSGGPLYYHLSPAAQASLRGSSDNRLSATVTLTDSSGAAQASAAISIVGFTTSGTPPPRSSTPTSDISFASGTAFVSSNGTGAALVQCRTQTPCLVKATVTSGGGTLAQSGAQYIGGNQLGYVYFTLSSAGESQLAATTGNQLAAQIAITGAGPTATANVALVGFH